MLAKNKLLVKVILSSIGFYILTVMLEETFFVTCRLISSFPNCYL